MKGHWTWNTAIRWIITITGNSIDFKSISFNAIDSTLLRQLISITTLNAILIITWIYNLISTFIDVSTYLISSCEKGNKTHKLLLNLDYFGDENLKVFNVEFFLTIINDRTLTSQSIATTNTIRFHIIITNSWCHCCW